MLRCWIKCGGVFFLIFVVHQHFFLLMNFTLMTVLYIIAALVELAPQFVNEFIMQWENCMVGYTVIAAMFQFRIRSVQFRKYLKNKSSDLGILTVLEILGRKKNLSFFFLFFLDLAKRKAKRQCILFELQGWRVWVLRGAKEKAMFLFDL